MRLIDAEQCPCNDCVPPLGDSEGCPIFPCREFGEWYETPAYDIDKVCEELASAEYPLELYDADGQDVDESLLKTDMVEAIVRRGGVD